MISYEPLWQTLKRKGISTYALIKDYSFSKGTLDALKNNRNITTFTLNNICNLLNCEPMDVIRYTPDVKEDRSLNIYYSRKPNDKKDKGSSAK